MPITMSSEEWFKRTSLGPLAVRPAKLKILDRALDQYNRISTDANQVTLRNALLEFIAEKGTLALKTDPRNGNNAVDELYGQLFLGRRTLPVALKTELLAAGRERQGQIFGGMVQKTLVDASGHLTRTRIKKIGHVHDSDVLLRIVADDIQKNLDCRISYGPIKLQGELQIEGAAWATSSPRSGGRTGRAPTGWLQPPWPGATTTTCGTRAAWEGAGRN